MMRNEDIPEWLDLHIPSRFRAARAHTNEKLTADCILDRYAQDAVQLGRLTALRWLIEFVGIKADPRSGKATERKVNKIAYPHDIRIEELGGKILATNSSDAQMLANVWSATSQAVGHPTHGSGHHSLDLSVIVQATDILQEHIQNTLYKQKSLELSIGSP